MLAESLMKLPAPVCRQAGTGRGFREMWSPTGIARGTLLHARVGRHPGQTLAHSSTGKARGFLLPG